MKTKRSRKRPEFNYADTFDQLMTEQFGDQKFKTEWSLFAGSFGGYVTTRDGKKLTSAQILFGRGASAGISAYMNFSEKSP